MKLHKWKDIKNKNLTPEQIAESDRRVERELLEMDLAELRKALSLTQVQVAQAAEMAQGDLSRLERRDDSRISTLRRVVEAMGGKLEVHAIVGDKDVKLAV